MLLKIWPLLSPGIPKINGKVNVTLEDINLLLLSLKKLFIILKDIDLTSTGDLLNESELEPMPDKMKLNLSEISDH